MTKAFKFIAGGAFALLALAGASGSQALFRFDLYLNPVAAPIKLNGSKWGDKVDLSPRPVKIGDHRAKVLVLLRKSGFSRTPDETVWKRYEGEILDGNELYEREAESLICQARLYVFLKFDDEGRLVSAQGAKHEHGCL